MLAAALSIDVPTCQKIFKCLKNNNIYFARKWKYSQNGKIAFKTGRLSHEKAVESIVDDMCAFDFEKIS